jgi:hypothetical protein
MNSLTKELVRGLIEVDDIKVVALYGGGFKPPIKGHFNVIKKALDDYPEITKLIIFVGAKERDGINQEESLLIWDIYKNYLPSKVSIIIEPVISPIEKIYNYSKENLQEKIYWILGIREGEEDDNKDLKSRQINLLKNPNKYPNLSVKVIVTKDKEMRGRNARKTINNREEFFKYLPDIDTKDKEKVFNLVSLKPNTQDIVSEKMSTTDINTIEDFADKKLTPIDIDLTSNHFFDRLNDPRNQKEISVAELIGFFKRLSKRKKEFIEFLTTYEEVVAMDNRTNINIPFMKLANKAIAKTVMRKKDFQTSTPFLPLNENATYSKDIDYKQMIVNLTNYMIKQGKNIEPLPKVKFINGDSKNAKNFLGKTAYYEPSTQTIVLYTEGRHPKDIVRSFSHEMVHHTQFLEDRLNAITTTNTQEDNNLNNIEAEANLKGTMTFRNWTDSLNENFTRS